MKRPLLATILAVSVLLPVAVTPAQPAHAGELVRDALVSCSFAAGSFAALTYVYVSPLAATGALAVPMAEVIAANAVLGCGVGIAGSLTASAIAGIYDAIF